MSEQKQIIQCWTPSDICFYGSTRRALNLYTPIVSATVLPLISQLLELEHQAPGHPIRLHINTEGGSLTDALALYDTMRNITSPILTVATGVCSSAGLLILAGGDYRVATENTMFFYHEPVMTLGEVTSMEDMMETTKAYSMSMETYVSLIKERINISEEVWKKEFEGKTKKYFNSEEALRYNFVKEIMKPANKKIS